MAKKNFLEKKDVCIVAYGEPFEVPRTMPDQEALVKIGTAVDEITAEVDRAMAIHPPPPWEQV